MQLTIPKEDCLRRTVWVARNFVSGATCWGI